MVTSMRMALVTYGHMRTRGGRDIVPAAANWCWNPVLPPDVSAARGLPESAGAARVRGTSGSSTPRVGSWKGLSDPCGPDSCAELLSLLTLEP